MSLLNNFTSLSQCYKNVVKTSNLIKTLVNVVIVRSRKRYEFLTLLFKLCIDVVMDEQ